MKITYTGSIPTYTTNDVPSTGLFQHKEKLYFMTSKRLKAVCLEDGALVTFRGNEQIIKATGSLSCDLNNPKVG